MSSSDVSYSVHNSPAALQRLRKRKAKETRFRMYGRAAIGFAMLSLLWLILSLVSTGYSAFTQNFITLDITFEASVLDPKGENTPEALRRGDYHNILNTALQKRLLQTATQSNNRELLSLVSVSGAAQGLRNRLTQDPTLLGETLTIGVPTSDEVDQFLKGNIKKDTPEIRRKISNAQIIWVETLNKNGQIMSKFNTAFFTGTDSQDAELAGIAGAMIGSLMLLSIAFIIAVPIGIGAAIYLDEFAPKTRWTDMIEININNLAAVPSVIFGLLGLAFFLNFIGLPRSAPLVGGMVLALRAFPTITIATRGALRAVPPSITEGALSVGASHVQAVFHHKLPLAAPGILTGTIISMALILGETAPLLMIGMVAFMTEIPTSILEPATALPVQIFLWSDSAERAWTERTAAAVIILLCILMTMNAFAIWLRYRLEQRR